MTRGRFHKEGCDKYLDYIPHKILYTVIESKGNCTSISIDLAFGVYGKNQTALSEREIDYLKKELFLRFGLTSEIEYRVYWDTKQLKVTIPDMSGMKPEMIWHEPFKFEIYMAQRMAHYRDMDGLLQKVKNSFNTKKVREMK